MLHTSRRQPECHHSGHRTWKLPANEAIREEKLQIAEFVSTDKIDVQYVSSERNIADIFTKALEPQRFQSLCRELNVEDVEAAVQVQYK